MRYSRIRTVLAHQYAIAIGHLVVFAQGHVRLRGLFLSAAAVVAAIFTGNQRLLLLLLLLLLHAILTEAEKVCKVTGAPCRPEAVLAVDRFCKVGGRHHVAAQGLICRNGGYVCYTLVTELPILSLADSLTLIVFTAGLILATVHVEIDMPARFDLPVHACVRVDHVHEVCIALVQLPMWPGGGKEWQRWIETYKSGRKMIVSTRARCSYWT